MVTTTKSTGTTRRPRTKPRPQAGRPSAIRPVGQGLDKYMRLLVYSDPGQGKTSLAGTSPRALILAADRSTDVLAGTGSTAQQWPVNSWNDMDAVLTYMKDGGTKDFDWLWLDTIIGFQERGLDDIMRDLVAIRTNRQLWAADKGEYGQNMNRLGQWLREARELPIHLGATTQMTRVEDFDEGDVTYMPLIQGKDMIPKVCSYFALIGRVELYPSKKDPDKELCRFTTRKEDGKFYGKDRFKIGTIVNPTIPKIMDKWEQYRAAKTTARKTTSTPAE